MCLHPEEIPLIPDETVRVAKAAFPKGNLYMRLRDQLGIFYQDEDFVSLYPQQGQPAQAPWRLAYFLAQSKTFELRDCRYIGLGIKLLRRFSIVSLLN